MLKGRIIKAIAGFYYVKTSEGIIQSRARGSFRDDNLTPLVGDMVNIRISTEDNTGYVVEIEDRSSKLLRPPVSNITQAVIVMSVKHPDINKWLLDKFIVMAEYETLDIVICINKCDLKYEEAKEIKDIYENIGYKTILTSVKDHIGIDELKKELKDNITVFAGPSGVGKSSLLNSLYSGFQLQTGDISGKTKRGKHTTRHIELLEVEEDTFVLDSPGFSSLKLDFIKEHESLRSYFKEIEKYGENCKFLSCLHDREPSCKVKENVEKNNIDIDRYKNYLSLLEEIKNIRRY
jgi:ribosome biogenesis GTPase / thiamine phosphate phosphatase